METVGQTVRVVFICPRGQFHIASVCACNARRSENLRTEEIVRQASRPPPPRRLPPPPVPLVDCQ